MGRLPRSRFAVCGLSVGCSFRDGMLGRVDLLLSLLAGREPIGFGVHFQNMDVVPESIEQRTGQTLRSEHIGPLIEGQIGGHQRGAILVTPAEDFEQQLGADGGERNIARFIDDQQF